MSALAAHVYAPVNATPADWSLLTWLNTTSEGFVPGIDYAAIYQKPSSGRQRECVLAFSGTNDKGDWAYNLWGASMDLSQFGFTGVSAHAGFYQKVRQFFVSPGWTQFYNTLTTQCQRGITAVGHSLGGATATLAAGLLNNARDGWLPFRVDESKDRIKVDGVRVSKLFTFGAPGVTYGASLRNANSADGLFQGGRYFNFGPRDYDLVAATSTLRLYHPSVVAVELSSSSDGSVSMKAYNSETSMQSRPSGTSLLGKGASVLVHGISEYRRRVEMMLPSSR